MFSKSKGLFMTNAICSSLAFFALQMCNFACSSSGPSTPEELIQPPSTKDSTSFSFENKTDPVSAALYGVYQATIAAPNKSEQIAALREYKNQGLDVLKEHPQEAAQQLVDDLTGQDPTNETRQRVLLHLLGSFESELGIQTLFDVARRELPEDTQPTDADLTERRPVAVASRLKHSAVVELGRLARTGNTTAQQRLLDLVKDASIEVKAAAILAYYQSNPPRWKAKRTMAKLLKPEDQYLVHAIY